MDATAGHSTLQPPDFLVLYRSLVHDGALPTGYDREFMSLEPVVKAVARREHEKANTITNVTAALWLDKFEEAPLRAVTPKNRRGNGGF